MATFEQLKQTYESQPKSVLGPDGRPWQEQYGYQPGVALPHVIQFTQVLQTAWKTYVRNGHDEALRHDPSFAKWMRNDPFLMGILNERARSTSKLRWHLAIDDDRDAQHVALRDAITSVIRETSRQRSLIKYLTRETIWYGRSGSQLTTKPRVLTLPDPENPRAGRRPIEAPVVSYHEPVNGDKFVFEWDGTPSILINTARSREVPLSMIVTTDWGRAVSLRGSWRSQFIVHKHEPIDADFFDGEQAGAIHGVGIRSFLYWLDWLRKELIGFILDLGERMGRGVRIWYYESGNAESERQVLNAARTQTDRTNILVPRTKNAQGRAAEGLELVDSSTAAQTLLLDMLTHWEGQIERFIIGQTGSSRSDAAGMGTHDNSMMDETKHDIVADDASNLQDTLTEDWVKPLQRRMFPKLADIPLRWEFEIDQPDPDKVMAAAERAFGMGVDFEKNSIRSITGLPAPKDGDPVISAAELAKTQQAMRPQGPAGPGGPVAPPNGGDDEPPSDEDLDAVMKHLGVEQPQRNARRERPLQYAMNGHKFSCAKIDLPAQADIVQKMSRRISDADLGEEGREDHPHVTALYGIHGKDADEVRKAVESFGPVRLRFGKTSLFRNPDADVLKIDLDSPDLHRLNKMLREMPHTSRHREYKPHVTVAYLKPGRGDKYAGMADLDGVETTLSSLLFSTPDKTKTTISLGTSERNARREPVRGYAEGQPGPKPAPAPKAAPAPKPPTSQIDSMPPQFKGSNIKPKILGSTLIPKILAKNDPLVHRARGQAVDKLQAAQSQPRTPDLKTPTPMKPAVKSRATVLKMKFGDQAKANIDKAIEHFEQFAHESPAAMKLWRGAHVLKAALDHAEKGQYDPKHIADVKAKMQGMTVDPDMGPVEKPGKAKPTQGKAPTNPDDDESLTVNPPPGSRDEPPLWLHNGLFDEGGGTAEADDYDDSKRQPWEKHPDTWKGDTRDENTYDEHGEPVPSSFDPETGEPIYQATESPDENAAVQPKTLRDIFHEAMDLLIAKKGKPGTHQSAAALSRAYAANDPEAVKAVLGRTLNPEEFSRLYPGVEQPGDDLDEPEEGLGAKPKPTQPGGGGDAVRPQRTSGEATDTPEFKKWFGKSKAVDEDGKPLTLYHGSDANFNEFDTMGGNDIGSHFGTKAAANQVAGYSGEGKVYPVHLSVQNPLRLPDLENWNYSTIADQLRSRGMIVPPSPQNEERSRALIAAVLNRYGYDGIVYKNKIEGGDGADSYMVFDPSKIKSATGNRGTFDQNDPDIRHQTATAQGKAVSPAAPFAPATPHHAALQQRLRAGASHLPADKQTEYGAAIDGAVSRLNQKTAERVGQNVKGAKSHHSIEALTSSLRARFGSRLGDLGNQMIAGAWEPDSGILHSDGPGYSWADGELTARRILLHEMGEAFNGRDKSVSNSRDWQQAWQQDLAERGGERHRDRFPLTVYATANQHEGFAEFFAYLHDAAPSAEEAAKRYPNATKLAVDQGWFPGGKGQHTDLQEVFDKPVVAEGLRADSLLPEQEALRAALGDHIGFVPRSQIKKVPSGYKFQVPTKAGMYTMDAETIGDGAFDISFRDPQGRYGQTGRAGRGALAALSAMGSSLQTLIRDHVPREISFVAMHQGKVSTGKQDQSRANIYENFAKWIGDRTGYEIRVNDDGDSRAFDLIRKPDPQVPIIVAKITQQYGAAAIEKMKAKYEELKATAEANPDAPDLMKKMMRAREVYRELKKTEREPPMRGADYDRP